MRKDFFSLLFLVLCICCVGVFANEQVYSAKAVCLYNATDDEMVYGYNENLKLSPASITKIVTAGTALKLGELSDVVTVDEKSPYTEGSGIGIKSGEKFTLEQLLHGLMLSSGNDCANTIATHFGYDEFVDRMNDFAKLCGARNCSFKNPSGLDEENHLVTAIDMAKITKYALLNEDLKRIVSTKNCVITGDDGTKHYLKNHNKLLWYSDEYIGVKTGFTKKSGRTLVSARKVNNKLYICVTLKAPDDWNDHERIYKKYIKNQE